MMSLRNLYIAFPSSVHDFLGCQQAVVRLRSENQNVSVVQEIVLLQKRGNLLAAFTALPLVIVGAVNWFLVGIFRFDLVAFIFGNLTWISRIVYMIVGLCGLYLISLYGRMQSMNA